MKIGAHVAIAGGLPNAIKKAKKLGAECIQIFPAPPQMWKVPDRDPGEIQEFKQLRKKSGIDPVVFHSIYLINLASPKNSVFWGSIGSLRKTLEIAAEIGALGVIFHVGSSGEKTFTEVLPHVAKAFGEILKNTPKQTFLIIENSAGAGNLVGDKIEEIGEIIQASGSDPRIKVCLDTQHLFASGYNIADKKGVEKLFTDFAKKIGLERLIAIHANDSKSECGSNLDRHENIGKGKIGIEGFKNFFSHKAVKNLPIFIETPGFEDQGPDEKNLAILKTIRKELKI